MRGPFCRSLIFAAPLLLLVGCAEAGVDGPLPVYQAPTSHGGPTHPAPSVASEQIAAPAASKDALSGFTPADPSAPTPSAVPRFRDYAAYSLTDRTGRQWLSQTLLDLDGGAHSERFCPIDDRLGTLWDRCRSSTLER